MICTFACSICKKKNIVHCGLCNTWPILSKHGQWLCYLTTFSTYSLCVCWYSVRVCLHFRCEASVGSISRRLLVFFLQHWHQIDTHSPVNVHVCVCPVDKSKKRGVSQISGSTECYKLSAGTSHPPYDATQDVFNFTT